MKTACPSLLTTAMPSAAAWPAMPMKNWESTLVAKMNASYEKCRFGGAGPFVCLESVSIPTSDTKNSVGEQRWC